MRRSTRPSMSTSKSSRRRLSSGELRAAHALGAQVEHAALGERLVPDLVVVVLDRPFARGFAFRRREVREVHVAVRREIRVEHDVVKALRGDDLHGRHAADRLGDDAGRRHGSQRAAALGDEEVAVRQERERPRARQLVGDDLGLVARFALRRRRFGLPGERGLRFACLCSSETGDNEAEAWRNRVCTLPSPVGKFFLD